MHKLRKFLQKNCAASGKLRKITIVTIGAIRVNKRYKTGEEDVCWYEIKSRCIKLSKDYCKRKAKVDNKIYEELQELTEILTRDYETTEDATVYDSLQQVKSRMEILDMKKTESAIFRSKAEYIKSGEKNTKYFFGLEKRRYYNKNMQCVVTEYGESFFEPKDILNEQVKFYKNLYQRDPKVDFNIKRVGYEPKLNEIQKSALEENISTDEMFDAIMTLKSGKVAGSDGLSLEFYRNFFHELKSPLIRMYQFAFNNGILPRSARRGLVSLLPKRGKDSRFIEHHRPLTLQNCDYKILAKILDNRIRAVIDELIHQDQTGFLAGRGISTNIRKTLDIVEYCRRSNKPALIMSIDMEKCFDKISYSAITGSLKFFNFGDNFIKWSTLLFTSFEICTQNNGYLSDYFVKERSINQGCPYSPSFFLLISEIMAIRLRNHAEIKGISIGKIEMLLSQFADDMDLYLSYEQTVLSAVLDTLDLMELNMGFKVSYDKTTLYRIGSIANSDAKLYTAKPIKWSSMGINTLGVDIFNKYSDLTLNYDHLINKLKCVAKIWYYRSMTWMGKVLIINSLMSSLFVYRMQVLPPPSKEQLHEIELTIKDFMWKGRRSKISLDILRNHKLKGGLELADFRSRYISLLLNWVPKLEKNYILQNLAEVFIGKVARDNKIWKANLHVKDINQVINTTEGFWYNMVYEWCKVNYHFAQSKHSILKQHIWLNSDIRVDNKVLLNQEASNKGLNTIEDICVCVNERFLTYEELCVKLGTECWNICP